MKTTFSTYRFCSSIAALFAFACWFLPVRVCASVQVEGIYYNLNTADFTAEVTHAPEIENGNGFISYYSGAVDIPSFFYYERNAYTVTGIGNTAFKNCYNLTSVSIPYSVTTIVNEAFSGCTSLISITCEHTIPVTISNNVFYNVNKSTCILYVPEGTKSAYQSASNWRDFTRIVEYQYPVLINGVYYNLNSVSLTASVTKKPSGFYSGEITIPETISLYDKGYRVTEIEDLALYDCKGLTSVTIQNGVSSIGIQAFYNCTRLTSIDIPNSVTSIGRGAFSWCTGLTSVTIPNSLTSIEPETFNMCNSLASVIIPNSVTSIGSMAFCRCFDLTSVTIPNGVTSIGYEAFLYCTGLTSVTIPNSVTSISNEAFSNCTSLTSFTCENETPVTITNSVFSGVNKSTCTLYVPTGSKSAYQSAAVWGDFANIVEYEGASPSVLATGQCGDNLTYTIYDDMSMVISGTGPMWDYSEEAMMNSDYMGSIKSVTIEEGCTAIGAYAFNCCYEVTSVTFPNSLTAISEFAFNYCIELISLYIPEGVIAIGNYAFENCINLSSITVDIDNTAYDSRDNCNAIINTELNKLILGCKNTIIPVGVTSIGLSAFENCPGLTSIDIPDGVTEIGWYAFMSCHNLTAVSIPHSVTQIGAFAFLGCNSLTAVAIPNSVTYLGGNAFNGCTGLTSVTVEWNTPLEVESSVFDNVDKSAITLYVPTGTKSAYQEAEVWGEFENIVEIGEIPDTDISALDNAIYIEQTEGLIGSTMDISVKMKNNYDVRAFQFKIELPEGTSINNWTLNQNRMPEGTTINDAITTDYIEGNGTVYACIIRPYMTFTGNDGEVVTINVTFANDMTPGIYPIFITNPALSDVEGSVMSLNEVKSTLVLSEMGDTNGDGQVLIGDVISILNYILGSPSDNFNAKAADVNDDGMILIGDVIAVLNIILNQ